MGETDILQWIQSASTPMLGLLIFGGYKMVQALHEIDRRLFRLEHQMGVNKDEKI